MDLLDQMTMERCDSHIGHVKHELVK
jgi:hypothetical protein